MHTLNDKIVVRTIGMFLKAPGIYFRPWERRLRDIIRKCPKSTGNSSPVSPAVPTGLVSVSIFSFHRKIIFVTYLHELFIKTFLHSVNILKFFKKLYRFCPVNIFGVEKKNWWNGFDYLLIRYFIFLVTFLHAKKQQQHFKLYSVLFTFNTTFYFTTYILILVAVFYCLS